MNGTVGIVGCGRLGRSIGSVLAETRQQVVYCDADQGVVQWAKSQGLDASSELAAFAGGCELILLCVPAEQVGDVVYTCVSCNPRAEIVSLVTKPVVNGGSYRRARPIAQHLAIADGRPWAIVVDDRETADFLRPVLPGRVHIVIDGALDVGKLNRAATRMALSACVQAEHLLNSMGAVAPSVKVGIRNILLGTIMEYDRDTSNPYLTELLSELLRTLEE
ncbi:hypothetical protein HMPREF1531_00813 [Propionibacterium sp. oral taxon 192 str. F0372]|uniref:NAD(P)-binding domain-containing protein n=1 Tax=Propionibacterium sp. oral taxon 192 TaxID=671222 RepID=UPI000352EB3F|nr:NAD(P)-binding domain-containing protein [Propionibacterium sp. oral taxon 192]EPH06164.1 hypothetical protein HMPREF1531_00813 [Propionibacterium sp. oral taxon 192 str. F0372]